MKQNKLSYATGTANAANGTTRNDAELAKVIIGGIEFIGGTIRDIYATGAEAIRERRQIIKEEIESFYKLDTNKNANLGYTIVLGIAILGLIAYKLYKDSKL